MLFSQLKIGDHVHVLEVLGTFKKTTVYSLGSITQVSNPYDEALPQGQFPIPGQNRRKLVDVFISCNGESKKLSVPAERSIINDTSIGLKEINDLKNDVADIRKMIEDAKKMFMGGFPKPPMPPMPNVPAPMK